MTTTVRWNPFARAGLERYCVPNSDGRYSCDWCGQTPRRLYAYGGLYGRVFCNLDCFDSYNG